MKGVLETIGLGIRFPARGRGRAEAGEVAALTDVTLALAPGDSLAVVGESGCGKSTLAQALLGLLAPTSGAVRWSGKDLRQLSRVEYRAFRSSVQMVFQNPRGSLNPRLTAGTVLGEALSVAASPGSRVRERPGGAAGMDTGDLLERVGLSRAVARARPSELSGGQCQRLGIARALAVDPELLILDEPTSALDVSEQARVMNLLTGLRQELGLGCLFISHDLPLVRLFSDRVIILRDGRIEESGTMAEVTGAPKGSYARRLVDAGLGGAVEER